MESVKRWYYEDRGKRAVEALKKRGFRAHYVETQAQAKEMILNWTQLFADKRRKGPIAFKKSRNPNSALPLQTEILGCPWNRGIGFSF